MAFSEITRFDDTTRLLGLNNEYFNTNDLVEAELQILDLQAEPKRNQKKYLEEELAVWKEFKTNFSSLTKSFTDLRFYKTDGKTVTTSNEGAAIIKAGATADVAQYTLKISNIAERHQLAGKNMGGNDIALNIEDTISIGKDNKEFKISSDMNLRDVVNGINKGEYGVSAAIISNRLVITSKDAGIDNAISLIDGEGNGLQKLGILNEDGTLTNELQKAEDAEFELNGIKLTSSSNTINDAIEGLSIELTSVTETPTKFGVSNDNKAALEAVKKMLTTFNAAVGQYNKYTGEEAYLQGQSIPLSMRREMSSVTSFKSPSGQYLYEYGIQLDGVTPKDGILAYDMTNLEKMYNEDPKAFEEMFFGESGIGKFMEEKLYAYTGETGAVSKKIEGMQSSIESIDESLKQFDIYYENSKNTILAKYASFETMMSSLNSQLSYMESMLESLNGKKE